MYKIIIRKFINIKNFKKHLKRYDKIKNNKQIFNFLTIFKIMVLKLSFKWLVILILLAGIWNFPKIEIKKLRDLNIIK
jgi:hypothetical protein